MTAAATSPRVGPTTWTAFVLVALLGGLGLVSGASAATVVPPRTPLKVVQLGDSYSAGNGARDAGGDRNYTGVEGCYRSPTNWGEQFVDTLGGNFAVTYVNRACSGGVIGDVTSERLMGSVTRPFGIGGCPAAEYPDEEQWVRIDGTFADTCERRLRPQVDAVDTSVDVVLLTFGGNDARFADIVKQCFVTGFRDPGDCEEAVDFAGGQLPLIEERLYEAMTAMRAKMRDDARIVLVQYPYLVPDVGFRLTYGDGYDAGDAIRALGDAADVGQQQAASRVNAEAGTPFVTVVDGVKDAFTDHEPFGSAETWLWEPFQTRVPAEWYHYRPAGHEAVAASVSGVDLSGVVRAPEDTDLDIVFVVDTTGSMGGEIARVRADLAALVAQLRSSTNSFRVAVVSYRDFAERTGSPADYPSRVDLDFTDSLPEIQAAIDSLRAEGGGDTPETVFSGLASAMDLSWRPGVSKVALTIGDAPALSPEPISELSAAEVVRRSIAVDPVQVIGVDVGSLDSNGAMTAVAEGTGGRIVPGTSDLGGVLSDVLGQAADQPFAWLGVSVVGRTGEPVTFDASGSFDPSGGALTGFEWDFDGDGDVDATTDGATATTTYPAPFTGYATVRVTGPGGTALGSTRVVVNDAGSAPMGDDEACLLDEEGFSVVTDDEGRFVPCTADALPVTDREGVGVVVGGVSAALDDLDAATRGARPPALGNMAREIRRAVEADDPTSACSQIRGLLALTSAQEGKKLTPAAAADIRDAAERLRSGLGCG